MGEFMKRISMLLIAVMVLSTVAASANPFSDVPFSHWAYDAVNKLAAKGIILMEPTRAKSMLPAMLSPW